MFGVFGVGASFAALAVTSMLPYIQGGPVAGAANEYALLTALAFGLGGGGFAALGLGAFVFSLNYEPIKQEAKLRPFSALPHGALPLPRPPPSPPAPPPPSSPSSASRSSLQT